MPRRRFLLTPRWLALHALTVVLTIAFFALGWWQLKRGEAGNTRSFAYALQWPTFALFVCFMWWSIIRHERGRDDPEPTPGDHATHPSVPEAAGEVGRAFDEGATAGGLEARAGRPVSGAVATSTATATAVADAAVRDTAPRPVADEDSGVTPSGAAAVGGAALPRVALRAAARRRSQQDTPVEGSAGEDDENLAAYNRYLARLNADTEPVTGQEASTTRGKEGA